MTNREDLLTLLNLANKHLHSNKALDFELKQLNWYSNPAINKRRYKTFSIQKKSGAERKIHAPVKTLKYIQQALCFVLECVFEPHKAAYGFVKNKSIVDNAQNHVGQIYVYNIDLKDFFPSIEAGRLFSRLQYPPFSLSDKRDVANVITWLCTEKLEVERFNKENSTWEAKELNVLPQGAPTSPLITNIICYKLDYVLSAVAKRFGLKYSRYADDITFSSMHNVYQKNSEFLTELKRVIQDQNFHIKESKTRLQKDGFRKEVTGLLVHESANVHKRYIKQLRMWLYYWERYGYEKAYGFFLPQYVGDRGNVKKGNPNMENVIGGKLEYLKMVKGVENELYLKLKDRLSILIGYTEPINQILDVWEIEGIEKLWKFIIRINETK
ncbi:MAG: RNA-directed DNA polymerase [Saprospiraceae bacterium]|nr:RNA-directed DNA polymerase [Candidatus Brachybacter algidus]